MEEGERDLWKSLGEYDEDEDDNAWLQDYEKEEMNEAISLSLAQQELEEYDKKFHSKIAYDEQELFPSFQKETVEESDDDEEDDQVITTTTTSTTSQTSLPKVQEAVEDDDYPEDDYYEDEEYPEEEEEEYDSEDDDEDMQFIKKVKEVRNKHAEVQKKMLDARKDKLKRIEVSKAKERYRLYKEQQERLQKEAEEEEELKKKKKKKKGKKKSEIKLPAGFQDPEEQEDENEPEKQKSTTVKPEVTKKIEEVKTTETPPPAVLPPTTPFRVPIIYKKVISDDESNKKDILIIPSIKFVSFLVYVYKTFALSTPPTDSLLYLDTNGKKHVQGMEQLYPNQTLYLIENVPKQDVKDSKKEEEGPKETIFETALKMSKTEVTSTTSASKKGIPKNKQEVDSDEDEVEPELRSPIVCVLGHVDTGKTSLLDKIRSTHVQEGEAGGITQQIGATYFPIDTIIKQTKELNDKHKFDFKIPGFLIIDTPGHESFSNLRSRGSSLCDIAILVVDIMHGLEAQTVESISLLKKRRIPFIIALNKIDRMYKWKVVPNAPLKETLAQQEPEVIEEFNRRMEQIIAEIAMQGLNSIPYYKNTDFKKMISICPTSAITGEGLQDLELLMVLLMQNSFRKRLHKLPHKRLRCSVLEVKVTEGLGATIDVLLVNGELNAGDKIVVAGLNGPIVTTVRTIITPHPLQELRVKGDTSDRIEKVTAVTGVRIYAKDLEKVVAGSALWVVNYLGDKLESEQELKRRVMEDIHLVMSNWARAATGVYVQASSLGSLEALLEFLKTSDVPIAGVNIGPVTKRDVIRASSAKYSNKGYACILAFDVRVKTSAKKEAEGSGVKIFAADIIYHLFDAFRVHIKQFRGVVKEVYPCIITILPEYIIKTHNPICIGAYVQGTIQLETTLCIPDRKFMEVGRVTAIRLLENPDPITAATNTMVIIKLEPVETTFSQSVNTASNKMTVLGREFQATEQLYAKITKWEQIPKHMINSTEEFVVNYKRIFGFKRDE